ERHAALPAQPGGGGVEGVQLAGNGRDIAPGRRSERGHPPVRDRQHEDPASIAAGEADRALQQRRELLAILRKAAPPVLVVDPDQQAGEVEVIRRRGCIDRRIQLVGGPAGGRDHLRVGHRQAFVAQRTRQLHRPGSAGRDALADGVRVTEGQVAQRPRGGGMYRVVWHRRPSGRQTPRLGDARRRGEAAIESAHARPSPSRVSSEAPIAGNPALRAIGWPPPGQPLPEGWSETIAAHPGARPARILEQHRSGYVAAEGPEGGTPVESLPEWQLPRLPPEQRAAVGDWVLVEGDRIVALLPRTSLVKRAAAGEHYRQQPIAANVDVVLVVTALDADFNPRRIERYLLPARGPGVQPVVVLAKADQPGADAEAAIAALADVTTHQVPVVAVNARDPASVAVLDQWLRPGVTAALVGSSGAGKSTLTNTLLGEQRMKTAAVRERDSRGRHTTTWRALVPLASGACLIDTPGMRELKPTGEE